MTHINKITIKPLTPERMKDFLSFFDDRAFADNPKWSFCYCYFNQFPHEEKDWKDQETSQNRNAVCDLIQKGKMNGYLAYDGDDAIGWCNAGPRTSMTTVPEYHEPEEYKIGSIMCFLVQKAYRNSGIAKKLLTEACKGLLNKGFTIIEAYPLLGINGEKENHFGPLAMYKSAGFRDYKEDDGVMVVRYSPPAE